VTSPAVQFDQLDRVPLAVIRRQASASELSRIVPQCCGLVWDAVRAQQARAGRHVAVYWDGSAFAWKSGWSFMDRLPRTGMSSPWHGQLISGLIAAWALRTMQFASGVEPTIAKLRVQIGRYTTTGRANGIRIHRRSEPMSTAC
jgi:hypothetical protein